MSAPFIGEIRMFAFGIRGAPDGWQACDGSLLAISEYDALFALIGTTYGGDGQTTFAVPDLRGRLPIHQGTGGGLSTYVLGEVAGVETVTLLSDQMPAHTHMAVATTATATAGTVSGTVIPGTVNADSMYLSDITGLSPFTLAAQSMTLAGGNQSHENCMPTLTVQFCIATVGIFPSPP